jgi:RNA polymerase sigma factor (sigma-70 family)
MGGDGTDSTADRPFRVLVRKEERATVFEDRKSSLPSSTAVAGGDEEMKEQSRSRPLARAVLRTQPDHRLVALAREGRDSAFDEIVRRYRPGLVAFAAAYAPRDSAEDVVQEGLAAAWRAMHESETEIQLKPWLYTIVRNRALNARRDARPHEPLGEDIDGVLQPDEIALTNEELERAVAAVNALPPTQRKALVRSALDGRTHDQIAAELGSSPGAVGQLVFRARAGLRNGLGLLIPLPLLRLLLEPGAEAAAGAAGAGAAAAAAGGGGSMLAKGAAIGLVGVIAAGSGVAIERSTRSQARDDAPVASRSAGDGRESLDRSGSGSSAPATTSSGQTGSGDDGGSSGPGPSGEDDSGDEGGGSENSGPGSTSSGSSASSGPGGGEDRDGADDDSGSSGSGHSGLGDDDSGSGSSGSGHSGSGSSGSGHSGSGSSGSGHSGSGSSGSGHSGPGSSEPELEVEDVATPTTTTTTIDEPDEDNSGSGSSGSGSSGSGGSSGPG